VSETLTFTVTVESISQSQERTHGGGVFAFLGTGGSGGYMIANHRTEDRGKGVIYSKNFLQKMGVGGRQENRAKLSHSISELQVQY